MVVNTQRKPHKPAKTAPTQSTKKVTLRKQKAVVIPLEKKVIPPTPPKQHLPLEEAIANISAHWPQLFPMGNFDPWRLARVKPYLRTKKVRELPISTKKLKRSLAAISHSVKYRTTIMPDAVRYDKDGQPNGTVTESDVADTLKRIQNWLNNNHDPHDKTITSPVTVEEKNHWLGKLAFAALIALKLAQWDGKAARNAQSENLFSASLATNGPETKRFHRCVVHDFEWLIRLGQQRLMTSKLKSRLEYLWRSCCCDMASQSDLFRLTYATELLKDLGWDSVVLSEDRWQN